MSASRFKRVSKYLFGHPKGATAKLIPSMLAGTVVALSAVITGTGVAILAFPGELQPFVFICITVVLFSATVMLATSSLTSSYQGTISLPQEAPAAVLGLLSASIFGILSGDMPPEDAVAVVVAAMGMCTALTGLFFFVLGRFHLGGLIRYIPYPVIGGMLASLGLLLLQGGASLMVGAAIGPDFINTLSADNNLVRLGTALTFGLMLLIATQRFRHVLLLPGLLFFSATLFYLALFIGGGSISGALSSDWLLGPFPDGITWQPISTATLASFPWGVLFAELPAIATLIFISSVSILLYASGVELAVNSDMDLDKELRACGLANIVSGMGGGVPGFHSMSDSILTMQIGAPYRATGLFAAAGVLACLLGGLQYLAYFPRPVLAGLLMFLGLSLLIEWLYAGLKKLNRGDYIIVCMIVVCAAWFGYLQAISVGVVAGVVLFVVNYSKVSVAKHSLSGSVFRSNIDRPAEHRHLLGKEGDCIEAIVLQGFIFFGTANSVLETVKSYTSDARRNCEYIILDFERVSGLDSSALITLRKLDQHLAERQIRLVFASLTPEWEDLLRSEGIGVESSNSRFEVDLDHAMEWCEEEVLTWHSLGDEGPGGATTAANLLPEVLREAEAAGYMEALDLEPGEYVMKQGEASSEMYFVQSGWVSVKIEGVSDTRRLRVYGRGNIIGEIAMYLDQPRTASIVTETHARLLCFPQDAVDRMMQENPDLAANFHAYIARTLCERIVSSNQLVRLLA